MTSGKQLFLSTCLLLVATFINEKGAAQNCYQNSDCPNYKSPLNIPGSWQGSCINASIYCWAPGINQCMLQAECLDFKQRYQENQVSTSYAISCANKGKDLSNHNATFKCVKK